MMSKKMAKLEDDFREFKAHTERRFVSLDMSIRAYRLEEDEKEFENTRLVAKEDKDEQGKEEKGVVKFFEVGNDEECNTLKSEYAAKC
ncbi:hypothetical protein Tco_0460324 [Tanacetum coccineum]